MPRILSVASGKGGVGKTTIVSNLGAALTEAGKDVTIVDGNLTTANLSLHFGIPFSPVTLHDVLRGDAHIDEARYIHPSGVKVVPSGIGIDDLEGTDSRDLPVLLRDMMEGSDFVILDTAAGLGQETISTLEASDEVLIVTEPTMPSTTDALKTKNLAEKLDVGVTGLVINGKSGAKGELKEEEIADMLDNVPVLAKIPHDENIIEALSEKKPLIHHKPHSPAGKAMQKLASEIVEEEIRLKRKTKGLFGKIADFLRG